MTEYEWRTPETAKGLYANINGERIPAGEATLSVYDRSFLYGDAVFDSFPVYSGKVILLDRHVDRLFRSAKAARIEMDVSKDTIKERVVDTLEAGSVRDGSVRVIVTRGNGPTGLINTDQVEGPNVFVLTSERPEESFSHGGVTTGTARIASTRATPADVLDPKIKSCNYLSNALAERERVGTDAEYTIMLDQQGNVAEAYAANVFVRDHEGTFRTPALGSVLAGLTRKVLTEVAEGAGHDVVECELTPYDLYTAEDLFLTSSGLGIAAVTELDGQIVGDGEPSGELTALADEFFDYIFEQENTELSTA
jgi:branched-chain amino acid aminotransferase